MNVLTERQRCVVFVTLVVGFAIGPAVATAQEGSAYVTFSDQGVDGTARVNILNASLPDGGFLVLYQGTGRTGEPVGETSYLSAGFHADIQVPFDSRYYYNRGSTTQHTIVAYRDSNGNGAYDPGVDEPYTTDRGDIVSDSAAIEYIVTPTPTEDPPEDQTTSQGPSSSSTAGPTVPAEPTDIQTTLERSGGSGIPIVPLGAGALVLASLGIGWGIVRQRGQEKMGAAGGSGGLNSSPETRPGDGGESGTTATNSPEGQTGTAERHVSSTEIEDPSSTESESRISEQADGSRGVPSSVTDSGHAGASDWRKHVPETIPRAPDLSFEYGDLTTEEFIGGGGNADVHRATVTTPDGTETIALKEPRVQGTLHTSQIEQLMDEAEVWEQLDNHDHIVGLLDWGSEPLPWLAMEYMDGGHLGARAGQVDLTEGLWTAIAITKAVRHAHRRGVAHLDLKPENVLYRTVSDDRWAVPKVADWGLSKHLLKHSKSVEGISPTYAAPEQFDDDYGQSDDLTDIYQLGAVFYELFTGQPPFEGRPAKVMRSIMETQPTPPSDIDPSLPSDLDSILLKSLAKSKEDRYESVLYLRDELQALLENQ